MDEKIINSDFGKQESPSLAEWTRMGDINCLRNQFRNGSRTIG